MDRKRKKRLILFIILLVILCTAVGAVSAIYLTGSIRKSNAINSSNNSAAVMLEDNGIAIDGMTESKTPEEMLAELQAEQINVTDQLSSCIVFPSGEVGASGSWTVENLASNNVIMQCEVYLGEDMIAKTAAIRPNQHIENVSLLKDLES